MTGPEFYKAATEALDDAEGRIGDCTPGESAIALAMIGVGRATLALAAATALANYCGDRMTEGDSRRWFEAASAHPEHLRLQRERAEAAEFAKEPQS